MAATLYYHPLSSYCWKALIGLYEAGIEFTPVIVNLGDPAERAAFQAIWPIGKFPVIRDEDTGEATPEASVILDWIDGRRTDGRRFIPADPDAGRKVRLMDRILDLHLHDHMQRIVGDRLRPAGAKDPHGVAEARAKIAVTYGYLESVLGDRREWICGAAFGMADCAALPALFYGDKVQPLGEGEPRLRAYLERLKARPSVQRVLAEAEPYFQFFPTE
jgi:glutathione S-transferase